MVRCFDVVPYENEQDWLELRRLGLGGTDMAGILGESHWSSPYKVWAEKTGRLGERERSVEAEERMWWGKALEEPIRIAYSLRTGRWSKRSQQLLRSKKYPWAQVTIDAWTGVAGNSSRKPRVVWPLEIKTLGGRQVEHWENGVPSFYKPQVQHAMLVTGADKTTVAALVAGQRLIWDDCERDEVMIARIIEEGERMMQLIRSGTPPPVDGSLVTRSVLNELYPSDNGQSIVLGGDFIGIDEAIAGIRRKLSDVRAEQRALEKELGRFENNIIAALGANARAVVPNGVVYEFAAEQRPGYTVGPSTRRVLRRKEKKED